MCIHLPKPLFLSGGPRGQHSKEFPIHFTISSYNLNPTSLIRGMSLTPGKDDYLLLLVAPFSMDDGQKRQSAIH